MTERRLTGFHVAGMFVSGFAIIIAVNLVMASSAIRTFPGTEVKNSYVASQSFDARRAAQEALGWKADATYDAGVLTVTVTNASGDTVSTDLQLSVGWPTRTADLEVAAESGVAVPMELAAGRWRVDVNAIAPDGTPFQTQLSLWVRK